MLRQLTTWFARLAARPPRGMDVVASRAAGAAGDMVAPGIVIVGAPDDVAQYLNQPYNIYVRRVTSGSGPAYFMFISEFPLQHVHGYGRSEGEARGHLILRASAWIGEELARGLAIPPPSRIAKPRLASSVAAQKITRAETQALRSGARSWSYATATSYTRPRSGQQ